MWLNKLAILSVLGFPLAVLAKRLGWLDYSTALKIVAACFVLAIVVFFVSMLMVRASKPELASMARIAGLISLIPMVLIGWQASKVSKLPKIHNISTDVVNPPAFDKIASLRSKQDNPLEYNAAKLAEVQRQAYPDVKSLVLELSSDQAYQQALNSARDMGWTIVNQQPEKGIIEATATTKLWGFKDDVVIRLTSQQDKTIVDLRSVSRVGKSDVGANAERIIDFLTTLQERARL